MKLNLLKRFTKPLVSFIIVLLCSLFTANSQCPSITDPSPPAICDAAGYTFSDLSNDFGPGVVWYNAQTGGQAYNPNQLVTEGIFYAGDSSGTCGVRQSITIDFQVNRSGQNLDGIYCSNENATVQTYINEVLQPNVPPSGTVVVYYDFNLTTIANTSDPIPNGGSFYYIVFEDSFGCRSQLEIGSTATFVSPQDPTPADPQLFCSDTNPTIADLDPGTTSSFLWYQNVDGLGDPIPPALSPSTPLVNGATYYVQVDDLFCDSNAVPVTVTINVPFEPGTPGNLEYCDDSIPTNDFDLFDELGGPKDNNGTWSGPLTTNNGHLGTVNISSLTTAGIYTFTYTVPSIGACPEASANVTITIYETLSSGTVSATSPAIFCEKDLPNSFDLTSLLDNEDPNGQWTEGINSSGTVINSPYDLTSLTPGLYSFTYTQNLLPNPCLEESTTVQVEVLEDPNAGNAVNPTFCENDLVANSPFDLFDALDNTQDNNSGTWTDAGNNIVSNIIDITGFTVAGSPYQFTYTISNGSCEDSETISITVEPAPESGEALSPVEICEENVGANSPFDLFTLLDGTQDTNGTWYAGTDTSGTAVANPIDISGLADGTYNYTYSVPDIGSCSDVNVTVQIIVLPQPETGTPTPAVFCENDLAANSPLDLFDQLAGEDTGGVWTDDDSTGALTGNTVDLTILTVGSYGFTYSITDSNGCTNSSTVVVTLEPAPESGEALAPIEICEENVGANSPFDLFTLLDGTQDTNGTWYAGTDTSGTAVANPIDISGLADGTYNYTYSVPDIGSCSDVDVTVQIIVLPQPETGTPTPAVFCENDLAANSPLDLFDQLAGEDTGGVWTDDDSTGALTGNTVDLTILTVGSYGFTYSITDSNGCTNSSTVVVTVEPAPESGEALAPIEICEENVGANSPFDLFTLLDGTQDTNGTWYAGTDTSGTAVANPIDISGLADGTYNYTYSVPDIGSCSDVDVTVQIIVLPQPETGTPTLAVFCENDLAANSPLNLFDQLAGEDTGGVWTDDDSTGALTGNTVDLTILAVGSYGFTYSITDSNGCTNSSTVLINVVEAPESGTPETPVEFCLAEITIGQTFNLFDLLIGEDQSGMWNDDNATGALSGNLVSLDVLVEGTFNFTFNVNAIGSCDDSDVTVSIIVNDTLAPTAASPQEFCDSATVAQLVAAGSFIQWYSDPSGGLPLDDSTALVDGENYYATQTNATTGCESSARTEVIATIYQSPNAGSPSITPLSACNDNNSIDLFAALDGTQDSGGTWQDTDGTGALTGNILDATGLAAGEYQFTYYVTAAAPCLDDSTTITLTIDEPLNAGTDNTLDICSDNGTIDLFSLLGTADAGGIWSPALDSGTGLFDPLVDTDGIYTYTLTNSCGTDSSNVAVTVTEAPDAGVDNAVTICVIDGVTDLFPLLGDTAQTGGTWFPELTSTTGEFDPNVDAAGTYTYTVTAIAPCADDAVAQITVTIEDSNAPLVNDPNPQFCNVNNPTVSDLDLAVTATGTLNWYEDIDLTIVANATDSLVDGEDYYVTQTNSSGCESSTSEFVIVTINDAPTPTLLNTEPELCVNDNPTINNLTINLNYDASSYDVIWYDSATSGTVVPNSSLLENLQTYYAALVDKISGCESSIRLPVTSDLTSCGELIIPDGFSPNGDGVNDVFEVDNLNILYPNFELEIYNRNGNIVYKGNANTPRFNGKSNQSRTVGSGDLPVGVYFYIFNFNDGENKAKQGRLYLSR